MKNKEQRRESNKLKAENSQLLERIQDLEQYSRKNNVIIYGLNQEEGENLMEKLKILVTKLEVGIMDYDVGAIYKLPINNKYKDKDKPETIIVKLNNTEKKNKLIVQSINRKLTGIDLGLNPVHEIYVNEHLTATRTILNNALILRQKGIINKYACEMEKLESEKT